MPITIKPFSHFSVDLVGPLQPPSSRGHKYVMTVVDQATWYGDAVPLRYIDAETVAQALMEFCSRVGFPQVLTTDNGTQFTAATFEAFLNLMGVRHRRTPPYHAQSNGLVELFNETLKTLLRRLAAEEPRDWEKYLAPLLFAYRNAPQASTGYSPFELIYGHKVRGPLTIMKEYWSSVDPPADDYLTTHQYLTEMRHRLKETCEIARDHLQNAQEKNIKYANRRAKMRTLQPGDHVLIFLADSPKKLLMSWRGPYVVLERIGCYNYVLDIDRVRQTHHINLLRKYFGRSAVDGDSTTPQAEPQAAAALVVAPSYLPEDTPIALNIVKPIYVNTIVAIEDPQDDALDDSEPAIPAPKGETLADCRISNELDCQQRDGLLAILEEQQWPCGVVVARLPHTQEVPGSIPGRGSYLRQVSLH